ncbi:MAG TPA: quinoprotein glucose dehydrogenase, partial [Pseudobacillus sp.]
MNKWILAAFLLLSGCASSEQPPNKEDSLQHIPAGTSSTIDAIAENLEIPWDITKSGDSFFISQRKGTIIRIDSTGKKEEMELRMKQRVLHKGEGGLLGF